MRTIKVSCDGCSVPFEGEVSDLKSSEWAVVRSEKLDLCPSCYEARRAEREIDKQIERDRALTIGKIRGSMGKSGKGSCASLLQKIVRLEAAIKPRGPCVIGEAYFEKKPCPVGYVVCVTCGEIKHYKESNGGHFISRKHPGTCLVRKNINPQCIYCNDHLGGNYAAYRKFMVDHYGLRYVEELSKLKNLTSGETRFSLAAKKVQFRLEIKKLEKELLDKS